MSQIVLQAIDLNALVNQSKKDGLGCNVQNLAEFLPYCIFSGSELHIEREWWDEDLVDETREKIRAIAAENSLKLIVVDILPKEGTRETNVRKPWTDLYCAVFEQYEYDKWASLMRSVLPSGRLVEIPAKVQKELARIAKVKVLTGRGLKSHDLEDLRDNPFYTVLSDALRDLGSKVFVKLPTTSSKNEQKMRPIVSADDCIDYITNTHCFAAELAEAPKTYLILLPWLSELDKAHEYRAFVHRGQITCISQQQWYAKHFDSEDPVRADAQALLDFFDAKVKSLMPFQSGVLDMWVCQSKSSHPPNGSNTAHISDPSLDTCAHRGRTQHTDQGLQGKFIEINPWGAGFSSGSSLFHWRPDFDLLYGRASKTVTVRYVSKAWEGGATTDLIELMDDLHLRDQQRWKKENSSSLSG